MTHLLIDGGNPDEHFIARYRMEHAIIASPGEPNIKSWLTGAWRAVKNSGPGDCIVCWFDFQAVLAWWICRLTLRRRKIGAVNLMLKDNPTLRNRAVSWLYKRALTARDFHSSVTSAEYGEWLRRKLKVDFKPILVRDVFRDNYEIKAAGAPTRDYVFCGGRNGRDWDFMIALAKAMPEQEFLFVMSESDYAKFSGEAPANATVRHALSPREFLETLAAAAMVCLPLDTEAPAGLIVMFQAAANDRLVLTTDTVTTRSYIDADSGVLLKRDLGAWRDAIRHHTAHPGEREEKARNLHRRLKAECSETAFDAGIRALISLCSSR